MAAKKKKKKIATKTPSAAPTKRAPAKKAPAKKGPAKKAPAKKGPAKKGPAKKGPAKKGPAKKAPAKRAPAKKAPAKRAPAKKAKRKASKAKPVKKPVARRDATGHLNPKYARELLEKSRESHDDLGTTRAFLKRSRSKDDLAEELGEEAVGAMTSGEDQSDRLEATVEEERGGPFVKTRGRDEYARGTDKSNPRSATREPFPRTR